MEAHHALPERPEGRSLGMCTEPTLVSSTNFFCHSLHRRSATQSSVTARARQAGNSASSMWKFYTGDDSPGYKVYVESIRLVRSN